MEKEFHDHASHHLLAIWAMGAQGPVIEAAYQTHCEFQTPAFDSPGSIDHGNLWDHLGNQKYYQAYLAFFREELQKKGFSKTFEEYVFSKKANYNDELVAQGKKHPEMLNRIVDGLFHPYIHVGYGAEFGLLGQAAEGLAMTAIHPALSSDLLLPAFFNEPSIGETISNTISSLTNLSLDDFLSPSLPDLASLSASKVSVHPFTILARVQNDKRFDNVPAPNPFTLYEDLIGKYGPAIREYAVLWQPDTSSPALVARHVEELSWLNVIIYGIAGWKEDGRYNADFFYMHLVTSVLFTPSLLAYLSPSSQSLLLRAYFAVTLAWYVIRGRPALHIAPFLRGTSALLTHPSLRGPAPSPSKETLPTPSDALAHTPNAWLPIVQTTLVHPNDHLCKIQRALAHFGSVYGTRERGHWAETELAGAEELDGSLFLRVARLTADRLQWMREGEEREQFDFGGFYATEREKKVHKVAGVDVLV